MIFFRGACSGRGDMCGMKVMSRMLRDGVPTMPTRKLLKQVLRHLAHTRIYREGYYCPIIEKLEKSLQAAQQGASHLGDLLQRHVSDRDAVFLRERFQQGKRCYEIAEEYNLPRGTVQSIIHRAVGKLREHYRE